MNDKVPAMYQHCATIYGAMMEQAEPYGDGGLWLWRGGLTNLFEEVGLGISRYTSTTKLLVKMGCIEQKHRGGGTSASEWILVKEPDLETFEWAKQRLKYEKGRRSDPSEQRYRDLNDRVSRIEQLVGIADAD